MNAAENIVIEEGLCELKVRKIAMDIGYTVGSIYMVFENMADLILHLKGKALDDLGQQLETIETTADPKSCLIQLAKEYLQFARQNYHRWSMVFEASGATSAEYPDWYQEKANHMFERVEEQFKRLAPQKSAQHTRLSARALWAGVHGICQLSLTGKLGMLGIDNTENLVIMQVNNFIDGWQHQATHD